MLIIFVVNGGMDRDNFGEIKMITEHVAVPNNARQACNLLLQIAENTNREGVPEKCTETVKFLCEKFGITVFGLLPETKPDYSNPKHDE